MCSELMSASHRHLSQETATIPPISNWDYKLPKSMLYGELVEDKCLPFFISLCENDPTSGFGY